MKISNCLFCIVFIGIGCQINTSSSEQKLVLSCQRLLEVSTNKVSDTLMLQQVLDSAYEITIKASTRNHDSLVAVVSRIYGNAFYGQNDTKAKAIYLKGLSIGLRQLAPIDDIITRLYGNVANIHYSAGDYKTALLYYDSIKIVSKDPAAQKMKVRNLMLIAESYKRLKDLNSAERIFKETELLANRYFQKSELGSFYTQYASSLQDLKKYKEAIENAEKGLSLIHALSKDTILTNLDSTYLSGAYARLAFIFYDSALYQFAEKNYVQALDIYKKQNQWANYRRTLSNMGSMYRFTKQLSKAENILTMGLKSFNQSVNDDKAIRLKASFYVNRSEVYLETKQYQKAIADHDSAIYFFTLYDKKPSLTAVMMQARPVLLSVLSDKAKAHIALAENGSDTEGYTKALNLTQQIIDLSDDIRADYFSDDAKLTLANDIKPALEKAIGLCQKLYQKTKDVQYLNKAFNFVEYSRSMVLYENARLDNQLPPDLKAENAELKKREAVLIAKNNVEDLQNYLRLKRQFREKIKSMNRNALASVSTLQTALLNDGQTALIEFFVGDSAIFVFNLLQNDLTLDEIPRPKNLEQQIEALRHEITRKPRADDATVFMQQSAPLYALLLRGATEGLPTSVTKWIVAPDGVLSYLPFELLSPPAPKGGESDIPFGGQGGSDFRKIDFLLKHYQISYAYSANLLLEQKRIKKGKTDQLFAGFASKYENKDTTYAFVDGTRDVLSRQNIYELPRVKEEVTTIQEAIGGKTFTEEGATEGVFKREASRYRILHFAMHSLTDNTDAMQSRLLFTLVPKDTTEDNDLTAAELYTMHLNADLAVLSACNTGFGTLNKGEGVMSLARAFTYAGVPSTVMSLWKASDATTPDIMIDFYKNLKRGMTKDAALREAKLTYLNNAHESIDANPFFWAGFVPIGNMETLDMTESSPLSKWGILAALLAFGGIGYWFWLKKKR